MARRPRFPRMKRSVSSAEVHRPAPSPAIDEESPKTGTSSIVAEASADLISCDDGLSDRARTQWQFGDWASLALLDRDTLQNHPGRAELALLAVAGRLQMQRADEAREYLQLAQEWGASKRRITQILVAGVHNSLGRAAALASRRTQAHQHFDSAMSIGMPGCDTRLLAPARIGCQLQQLGLEAPEQRLQGLVALSEAQQSLSPQTHPPDPAQRARYFNRNGEELYRAGLLKQAVEYFQRALDLAPENAWYCQNLAEATARLNVRKGDEWECEQLGQSIDETGKWDVAVRLYRRALKLDPTQVAAHIQQQTFAVDAPQPDQIDNPIFIVGCGHSGTSLMLAILGNHPRINPIPKESALFLRTDAVIQKQMHAWDAECKAQGRARWAEKTPPHIFQIERLLALRPKARIIIMLRDGRDVVCSLKPRIGYAAFEDRLERWIYDNMAGLPYWTHPQVAVVKYETLVTDTEATLRALCVFLGEEYSPQLLEYHKTEHRWYSDQIVKPEGIKTHSDHMNNRNWQINQPIFDGRGRWVREMSDGEKNRVKHSLGQQLLERFGYVTNSDW